jgi:hypothetical protein
MIAASGVSESRGDLLARQLILRREIFGRGSRSERTEHCRDVDAGPRDARLSESDFRVHRDPGINFHVKASVTQAYHSRRALSFATLKAKECSGQPGSNRLHPACDAPQALPRQRE